MLKKRIWIHIVLCLFPLISFAASYSYVCEAPQGTRVDYFSSNKANLQNDAFLMSKDWASSLRPRIIFNETKQVVFALDREPPDSNQSISATMTMLEANENQISFAGMLNGAPLLATFYPHLDVLIYSQQSIWPGPDYKGARALTFYAKCKAKV